MKHRLTAILVSTAMAVTAVAGSAAAVFAEEADTSAQEVTAAEETVDEAASETVEKDGVTGHMITDHAGNEVFIPNEIDSVVVTDIYPMASVLTVFLGSAENLSGIHKVSMSAAQNGLLGELYPEILDADTSFMDGANLNLESLIGLEPDVVFYNAGSAELGESMRGAGLNAVAVSVNKWEYDAIETYNAWIDLLAQIFPEKSEASEKVSSYSDQVYNEIQEKVSTIAEEDKKKVLFLFQYDDTTMITSGKKFFGQFWCDATGAINVAEGVEAENSNAAISMEQVYEWNPDVIFITNFTPTQPDDLYNNAVGSDDWSSINAVANKEVYKLPLGTYRSYTPSTDTPMTLLWMAQKVYPELFADVDMTQEVKDYYSELYSVELTDEQVDRMYNPSSDAGAAFSKK